MCVCVLLFSPVVEDPEQQHGEPVPDLGQRHESTAVGVPLGRAAQDGQNCEDQSRLLSDFPQGVENLPHFL